MGLVIVMHVIVCLALIIIVLVQSGRGGGLVESFSGLESMLGTKTNAFLTRTTNVLSILFFITCLSLAFLSIKQSRSLMRDIDTRTQLPGNTTREPTQAKTKEAPQVEAKTAPAQTQIP